MKKRKTHIIDRRLNDEQSDATIEEIPFRDHLLPLQPDEDKLYRFEKGRYPSKLFQRHISSHKTNPTGITHLLLERHISDLTLKHDLLDVERQSVASEKE